MREHRKSNASTPFTAGRTRRLLFTVFVYSLLFLVVIVQIKVAELSGQLGGFLHHGLDLLGGDAGQGGRLADLQ